MAQRPKSVKKAAPGEKAIASIVISACALFASMVAIVIVGVSIRDPGFGERDLPDIAARALGTPPANKPDDPVAGSPTELFGAETSGSQIDKKKTKKLIIIIDDVGWNVKDLPQWLRIPGPITFAILPDQIFSRKAMEMIRSAGKEYILHQPMEAITDFPPGPGAIYAATTPEEAVAIVERNLAALPGVKGINHHMGSLVSQDGAIMTAVLQVAKRHDIYYVDSFTIDATAVPQAARANGIRYWERDVFLDNSQDRESILRYLHEGMRVAEKRGYAIMIGHVWSADLAQILYDLYPQLVEQGFSLSTISQIMLEDGDVSTGD
jgi:hypothetical protein